MAPNSAVTTGITQERKFKEVREGTRRHTDIIASSHESQSHHGIILWMLVDGIGLALITACTILEGFELWFFYFNEYLEYNYPAMSFWFSGRFCQVMGLMCLISHAASLQVFHELEWAGMSMLTVGPMLNMCACSIFDSGGDASFMFNMQWMTTESLELLGILILDLSLIEGPEHIVLLAEIIGFAILACAAMIDFEFSTGSFIPSATIRCDLIHISDVFGLFLLTVVAIGQYYIKLAKNKTGQQQPHQHHSVSNHVTSVESSINSIQKSLSVSNIHMRHPQSSGAYNSVDSNDIEEERESMDDDKHTDNNMSNRSMINYGHHNHRMNSIAAQPYQAIQTTISSSISKPLHNGQHEQHND